MDHSYFSIGITSICISIRIYIYIHIFVYIPSHAIKFPYLFIVILSPSQAQSKYPLKFQIMLHISSKKGVYYGVDPLLWHTNKTFLFHGDTWWLIPLSKWVITPVVSGLTLLIPFITGVITHLLSGMSHQVTTYIPGTELHLHLPTPRVTGHRQLQIGGTIRATGIAETDGLHQFLPGSSAVNSLLSKWLELPPLVNMYSGWWFFAYPSEKSWSESWEN